MTLDISNINHPTEEISVLIVLIIAPISDPSQVTAYSLPFNNIRSVRLSNPVTIKMPTEAQIIGGHKANLHNANTSSAAKEHSKEVLRDEFNG